MTVSIGCRFTGKHQIHVDTESGAYWESLPKVEGSMATVQKALLAPALPRRASATRRLRDMFGSTSRPTARPLPALTV